MAFTAKCKNCVVYIVVPFMVIVFGMVLVDSMVFFNSSDAMAISASVKETGGVYSMGMLVLVKGLMVMVGGRVPVVL